MFYQQGVSPVVLMEEGREESEDPQSQCFFCKRLELCGPVFRLIGDALNSSEVKSPVL